MYPKPEEIISDEEIDRVHANANFGGRMTKREVVNNALLKCACGYHNGATSQQIIAEHGLIIERRRRGTTALTQRGRQYLWAVYGERGF